MLIQENSEITKGKGNEPGSQKTQQWKIQGAALNNEVEIYLIY